MESHLKPKPPRDYTPNISSTSHTMFPQCNTRHLSNGTHRLISAQPRQLDVQPQQALRNDGEQSLYLNPISVSTSPAYPLSCHRRTAPTCVLCRRRKVKCNRQSPCGGCVRAGVECIPSIPSRAPRGRKGGRKTQRTDDELRDRIAKLEGLVRDMEGSGVTPAPPPMNRNTDLTERSIEANADSSRAPSESLDKYLATSFWVTLSEEIGGLRDVLDESSNDDDEGAPGQTHSSDSSISGLQQQPRSSHSGFIFSGTSSESSICPTRHQIYIFCDIYLANVDPVLKILHAPSLRRYLQEDAPDLDCSPGSNGLEALKYAVYFAAIASIEDVESRSRTGEDKAVLLSRYRLATESALAKADFVNATEISTLQALTIYLTSVRVDDNSRFMWTLVSLAVRIAQAMGLHLEGTLSTLQPFEREMRRRLWWQICALDSHAAEDRASDPVIAAESFNTKLPLQINDRDIQFGSSEEVRERQGFTEMTFCLICHEIFDTVRQLNYLPARKFGRTQSESYEEWWNQRIDTVVRLQRHIEEKYLSHLNLARPLQWTARMVADVITATMWLLIYRPLQRRPDVSTSQIQDPGILRLAVDVLERAHRLYTDPAASAFRWLSRTHVQWHALSVAVAELCVKTEGPMVEKAWAILDLIFHETAKDIADSNKGMLWRPVKKLMKRARSARQHYLASHSAMTEAPTTATALKGSDHEYELAVNCEAMFNFNASQHQVLENATFSMEGLQQGPLTLPSAPFDWDPWLAAATTNPVQQANDMNLTAWTNWEDFLEDFQGQDDATSGVNGYASETSNFW